MSRRPCSLRAGGWGSGPADCPVPVRILACPCHRFTGGVPSGSVRRPEQLSRGAVEADRSGPPPHDTRQAGEGDDQHRDDHRRWRPWVSRRSVCWARGRYVLRFPGLAGHARPPRRTQWRLGAHRASTARPSLPCCRNSRRPEQRRCRNLRPRPRWSMAVPGAPCLFPGQLPAVLQLFVHDAEQVGLLDQVATPLLVEVVQRV